MKVRTDPPAVVMLAALLVLWTPLAPAHVHEPDAHGEETTVHRHFSPHLDHEHGVAPARVDHPDAPIVWLTESWLPAPAYEIDRPFVVAPHAVAVAADTDRSTPPRFNEVAPPHGPPRPAHSLRAPPLEIPALI